MPSFWGGFGQGFAKGFEKSWDVSAQEEKEKKSRKRADRARADRARAAIQSYREPAFEAAGYESEFESGDLDKMHMAKSAKESALQKLPAGKRATKKGGLVELEAAEQRLARGREDVLAERADKRWLDRLGSQQKSDIDKAGQIAMIGAEAASYELDLTRDQKLGFERDLRDLNAEFKDNDRHKDYEDWFNRLVATRQIKLSDDKKANMRKLASVYGATGMSETEMIGLIEQSYPDSINDGNVGELHAEWSAAIEQYRKGEGDLDRSAAMEAAFRFAQMSESDGNTWEDYVSILKDRGMEHLTRRGGVREAFESGKITRKYSAHETTLKRDADVLLRKAFNTLSEEFADATAEDAVLAESLFQFALRSRDTDDVGDSGMWFIEDGNPNAETNNPKYTDRIKTLAKMKLLAKHGERLASKDITDTGKMEIYRNIVAKGFQFTDDKGERIRLATRLRDELPVFSIIPTQVQREGADALGRASTINEIEGRVFWHPEYKPTPKDKRMVEQLLDTMSKQTAFDRQERGGSKRIKLSNGMEVEVETDETPVKPK